MEGVRYRSASGTWKIIKSSSYINPAITKIKNIFEFVPSNIERRKVCQTFKFHLFNADPESERGRSTRVADTVLSTTPAGKGLILIFLSSITVSPFSSPTSAGSFNIAISSSCLSRGKYSGSNLHCLIAYNRLMNK